MLLCRKRLNVIVSVLALVFALSLLPGARPAWAEEKLVISASNQVVTVFQGTTALSAFTDKTGIKVEYVAMSSDAAVGRLANGLSDMASIAQSLENRYKLMGFVEHPYGKDAIAIVTNVTNKVTDLSEADLRGAFSGTLNNWAQVGGPDEPFFIVIPDKDTALYRNFSRMFMAGQDVKWDLMSSASTRAADVARRFPGSLSFINEAATHGRPEGAKIVKVNGVGPEDPNYPYVEVFSLVTKGEPTGAAKKFLEYVRSDEGKRIMEELGISAIQ